MEKNNSLRTSNVLPSRRYNISYNMIQVLKLMYFWKTL